MLRGMDNDFHSVRADIDTASAELQEHEKMRAAFKEIASALGDIVVATLSLMNLDPSPRAVSFAGDAIDGTKSAMRALEAAVAAQDAIAIARTERLRELTAALQADR